jgi:hypothetical protein
VSSVCAVGVLLEAGVWLSDADKDGTTAGVAAAAAFLFRGLRRFFVLVDGCDGCARISDGMARAAA